jgi:hypothetical protein
MLQSLFQIHLQVLLLLLLLKQKKLILKYLEK